MANKVFCPIMTIGFNPPEEGKRDLRLCMKDCAWYDFNNETCKINVIAEHLEYLISSVDGIGEFYNGDFSAFEGKGYIDPETGEFT